MPLDKSIAIESTRMSTKVAEDERMESTLSAAAPNGY